MPRFRCRSRGPRERESVTFSVLPEQLLPRKQPSLPLVTWMLHRWLVSRSSLSAMLDELAETFHRLPEPWLPEISTVYRLLRLFALARCRVDRMALGPPLEEPLGETGSVRLPPEIDQVKHQVLSMLEILVRERGSPLVRRYHLTFFPRLLFEPSRSRAARS